MVKSWRDDWLEEDNRNLRIRLQACLELIDELTNLEKPLFEEKPSREFVLRYIRTVMRAKKALRKRPIY